MCAIMGYFGKDISTDDFERGFAATVSRGPDSKQIVELGKAAIGFHRLAIMGLTPGGMQPFVFENKWLVCNGEIYGFRKLRESLVKKGYYFKSDSDCEILLPLYKEHGDSLFKMLDAEYALVIYDESTGEIVAARDPIGIRPLYYGYDAKDNIAFASEPKNLVGFCKKVLPFPPGYFFHGNASSKEGVFTCYQDMTKVQEVHNDDVDTACHNIHNLLVEGVRKRLDSDTPVGFLLSGGLDSSLVCAIATKILGKPIKTFAIGMKTDAIDLKYAKQVADFIHSEHTEVIITKNDVLASLEKVIAALGTFDITTIRASVGMYLVCKYIHEKTNIRVILTGEISDELFGYKYTDFAPSATAFQEESQKRIKELHEYDVLRADRCISVNSLEARVPFGDLAFVKYVMALCPDIKLNKYNKGKYLLRHAFEHDKNGEQYLPESILMREKAAFSDAVGHSLVDDLKEEAERRYSDEDFEQKCKGYTHCPPFTKESLMYREIFEKYYTGQSQLITDFWMPNKEWPGCNVNDPSARVLSNYGASGV